MPRHPFVFSHDFRDAENIHFIGSEINDGEVWFRMHFQTVYRFDTGHVSVDHLHQIARDFRIYIDS